MRQRPRRWFRRSRACAAGTAPVRRGAHRARGLRRRRQRGLHERRGRHGRVRRHRRHARIRASAIRARPARHGGLAGGLEHRRRAGRPRPAARLGQRRARRPGVCAEMRDVSWREGRRRRRRRAGRRHRHARGQKAEEDGGQLLALRDHAVRLHPPRDAVQRAGLAERRRRLCRQRVPAQPQRHRAGRHDARRSTRPRCRK